MNINLMIKYKECYVPTIYVYCCYILCFWCLYRQFPQRGDLPDAGRSVHCVTPVSLPGLQACDSILLQSADNKLSFAQGEMRIL